MTTLASWNVNGIRACYKSGLVEWFKKHSFDVIGLQEVRAEESQVPPEILELKGYSKFWNPATSKKGYSGVAIFSKREPQKVLWGIGVEEFDVEGRVITAEFEEFYFVTAYFPNAQDKGKRLSYKLAFCEAIHQFVKKLAKSGKCVVLCGDFNIAHQPIDLARPDDNHESPGYLPEERAWMGSFLDAGWIDTFRFLHPNKKEAYSWWSARTRARERNVGWRIDCLTVPERNKDLVMASGIQDKVMGSDHCPVTLELKVSM